MQRHDILYVLNLLFHPLPPPNFLEDAKMMVIAQLSMILEVFPIDSSQYFHYNNNMPHFQDLLPPPTWKISNLYELEVVRY